MEPLDLVLREHDTDHEVWRGPLPVHTVERLVADTHLSGILAGELPNDGAPVRLAGFGLVRGAEEALVVEIGAGAARFRKAYRVARALADDVEVLVMRLRRSDAIASGTYRFACAPATTDAVPVSSGLRLRPPPRRFPFLRDLPPEALGDATLSSCRHTAIVVPRREADRLVAQARATSEVEVGALLVVAPFCVAAPGGGRLGVRIEEAVPLAHGTRGTATALRVTPEALAAVAMDERAGHCRGGLSHSHPFGTETTPHFLSGDDKAVATGFFWLPHQIQLVIDPRVSRPDEAIAAFAWVDGALARVCLTLASS